MKKTVFISLSAIIFAFLFSSCYVADSTFEEITSNYFNLAKKAKVSSSENTTVVDFGRTVTFNRLVLREKKGGVVSFALSLPGSYPFYENDFIGGYRYCAFPSVTTDKLCISATSSQHMSLGTIEAYYIPASDYPFTLTSYITAKTAYSLSPDADAPVDIFNLIYSVYLDKDGNVRLPDYYVDDSKVDGRDMLSSCIRSLRTAYPDAKILATVLGDKEFDSDGLSLNQRYSSAFSNSQTLKAALLSLIETYRLDGLSFDYEYPVSERDYSLFSDFCAQLKKDMPDGKMLTAAVSAWCVDEKRLNAKALSCFDRITLMAYDSPDENGCHSTFYTAYSQLRRLKDNGVPLSSIQLGLPLYSKPTDGTLYFPTYADHAEELSFFSNVTSVNCDGQTKPCYFNGRQLVIDKTSFAMDLRLGGVALWHYSLDSKNPSLSLIRTIYRTLHPKYDYSPATGTQSNSVVMQNLTDG